MNETELTATSEGDLAPSEESAHPMVLVVAWCEDEADRVGEVLVLPSAQAGRPRRVTFGRGAGDDALAPFRIRPGAIEPRAPFTSPRLSRQQLAIEVTVDQSRLLNVGRGALRVDGQGVSEVALRPGQVVEVEGRVMFLVERHPVSIEGWRGRSEHAFGAPDADGVVGESPDAWELRRQLDFLGPRRAHVLVRGPSGSGKELAAAGLHRRSARDGALVARNATTLPPGLVDAELFGNVRNYPNPGMPSRPGLVGAAHRGTLFLDEIGDLPDEVQPHLLRLLDGGEYQVLGDHQPRNADLRVVAATHRPATDLRHDLLARFPLRMELPGLGARRADVPLLARHLLGRILDSERDLAARFRGPSGEPRVSPALIRALLLRPWHTHVRELQALLWSALLASRRDVVEPAPDSSPSTPEPAPPAERPDWRVFVGAPPETIPPAALAAALADHNGHQERTAEALGLSSRFVLVRLLKRHKLPIVRRPGA